MIAPFGGNNVTNLQLAGSNSGEVSCPFSGGENMAKDERIGTHQKALSINLDVSKFGSFAEIGAGQEVARWFLIVGGASGTVAKTISAYDKEVSDELYGRGTRYVSKARLQAMMESEWNQLLSELQASRGATTKFFAFVDTVSARNYSGTNECHGWVGVRFQQQPEGAASDVILHINLQDATNLQQQEAVGILGVNLIYSTFYHTGSAEEFLAGLFEDLSLELRGPAFDSWDRRRLHMTLVVNGYAQAVAFTGEGGTIPPTELLYKKAVVLAPGIFERESEVHAKLIQATLAQVPKEEIEQTKGSLGMFCLSSQPQPGAPATPTAEHLEERARELQKLGYGTLVVRQRELYRMSEYVSRYTKARVYFAVGLSVVIYALQDRYGNLAGAVLEGTARLFTHNVRLSVYPMMEEPLRARLAELGATGWKYRVTDGLVYVEDLQPEEPLNSLFRYLLGNGLIVSARPVGREKEAASS